MFSHLFPAFLDNAAQMLVLLSMNFSPKGFFIGIPEKIKDVFSVHLNMTTYYREFENARGGRRYESLGVMAKGYLSCDLTHYPLPTTPYCPFPGNSSSCSPTMAAFSINPVT